MPRQIVGKGLRFSLRHAPCAHIGIFVGPSFDYDLETLMGVARLHGRRR